MITLNQIREFIIKQDKDLEDLLIKYIMQNNSNIFNNLEDLKKIEKSSIEELINKGKIDESKIKIEEYKSKYSVDVTICSMEGIIYLQKGELNKALSLFNLGLEIEPNNVDVLYNIAYTYTLLNDIENSIYYYNKCLELTNDNSLTEEIKAILQNLNNQIKVEKYTLIYIGIEEDDVIYSCIDYENYNLVKVILNENNKANTNNKSDIYTVYKAKEENLIETIEFIIGKYENCIIISNNINNINNLNKISDLKARCKIIYYTNNNLYTDKSDYLNNSRFIYLEKELCNICDIIITNDISVYIFKKILEERDNVYLFKNNRSNNLNINYILYKHKFISNEEVLKDIESYLETIKDEYTKSLYKIALNLTNIDECINYAQTIYDIYNNEETYKVYLGLLAKSDKYDTIYDLVMNSEFCDDIYKLEIKYLKSNGYYDLINFIVNLYIRLYKNIDNNFTQYKFAHYAFDINVFDKAYSNYMEIFESNDELKDSPLVIRNTSYLMYTNNNRNYEKLYYKYQRLLEDLYQ